MSLTDGGVELKLRTAYILLTYVRFLNGNARVRTETIPHIELKFQVDRACFNEGVTDTNSGWKSE